MTYLKQLCKTIFLTYRKTFNLIQYERFDMKNLQHPSNEIFAFESIWYEKLLHDMMEEI